MKNRIHFGFFDASANLYMKFRIHFRYYIKHYQRDRHAALRKRRITLFFQAYGMEAPDHLKDWVISRIQTMCKTLSERAAAGDPAFQKLVEEGHLAHYEQEIKFLEEHFEDWW